MTDDHDDPMAEWIEHIHEVLSGPVLYEEHVEKALEDTKDIIKNATAKWNYTPDRLNRLLTSFEMRVGSLTYEYDQGDLMLVDYDMMFDLIKIFREILDALKEIQERELS